jgi:radical SAM protein (TIGR01212 family)
MKRYNDLNTELRDIFGRKVCKLSLNGGFTCPNRIDGRGCLFCGDSGRFAAPPGMSISEQVRHQAASQAKKWKGCSYIAYFGTFTSTYADTAVLEKIYDEALACEGIVGLAVSTRPDCIGGDVLQLLAYYNRKTFLWVELGLQTIHESTHKAMETGYTKEIFEDTFYRLKGKNIRAVPHLIFGLPGEDRGMMLESVRYAGALKPWGIKMHMLYILRGTGLCDMYEAAPFHILSLDGYASLAVDALELIDKGTVIHRITGDPPIKDLYLPLWTADKKRVLQKIDMILTERDSCQGKYFMIE